MNCKEYQVTITEDEGDKQFIDLMKAKKFKHCKKCKHFVEKN